MRVSLSARPVARYLFFHASVTVHLWRIVPMTTRHHAGWRVVWGSPMCCAIIFPQCGTAPFLSRRFARLRNVRFNRAWIIQSQNTHTRSTFGVRYKLLPLPQLSVVYCFILFLHRQLSHAYITMFSCKMYFEIGQYRRLGETSVYETLNPRME